jgi:hypothetical protein
VTLVAVAGVLCLALLVVVRERFGGGAGLALALGEGAALVLAAHRLAARALPAAASVAAALATCAVPVAVRAVQQVAGVAGVAQAPADLDVLLVSPAFAAAAAWVLAAAIALLATGAPLLSAVLVAATWTAAMGAAPLAFGPAPSWGQRGIASAAVGYLALSAGVLLDRRTRRDHAAWLYLAGLIACWGGLTSIPESGSLSKSLGLLGNAALILAALALRRRIFAVVGAIGLARAVGQLAEDLLDPRAYTLVLAALGVGLAAGVVVYHRRAPAWERALFAALPEWGRGYLPPWTTG